jgi:DNA end-binding protein Ku
VHELAVPVAGSYDDWTMAAARSVATATLSFGLVSVPVKLYTATQSSSGVSFNMLHKGCGSRLKQQYLCAKENVPVERADTVKGYEFAKDQYVMFTSEELEALEEKATQTVDISEFVPVAAVDPIYYDKAYFIAPEKGGERAYKLLSQAMEETGRVALARYAARGKQYLVMVRPTEGGLVLQQLLYADEVRSIKDVPINTAEVKDAELALAKQLIGQISHETFSPENYEDDVKKRIQAAIQRKVEGQEVTALPETTGGAQIIDIMEALKASLVAQSKPAEGGPPLAKTKSDPPPPMVEVEKPKRSRAK